MRDPIGDYTTYLGDEIPELKGDRVRIFAVLRGALGPNINVDADDYLVDDNETLARLGGVMALDRIEIAHVLADGRTSFLHCDARAADLECFAALQNGAPPDPDHDPCTAHEEGTRP